MDVFDFMKETFEYFEMKPEYKDSLPTYEGRIDDLIPVKVIPTITTHAMIFTEANAFRKNVYNGSICFADSDVLIHVCAEMSSLQAFRRCQEFLSTYYVKVIGNKQDTFAKQAIWKIIEE